MSSSATVDRAIPHAEAWNPLARLETMRRAVRQIAQADALHKVFAPAYAQTYRVPVSEVEAEMIRNMPEGEGK